MKKPLKSKIDQKSDIQEKTTHALLNILEDIEKERNKVEEEKNKTLSVITHLTDGLLFFDENNKLSLMNYQAEKYLKVKGKELINKSIKDLNKLDNFKVLGDILGDNLKAVFRKELILDKDFIIEVSTEAMYPKGKKLGTLVILHDISREKMVEKIKSEFVSLAAHQLRTPLSAIKWTLKMLLEGDIGDITEDQRVFVEKSYLSNERMINLVNDLLDVTRIEEGRYVFKTTSVLFEELVNSVLDYSKREVIKKGVNLKYKKPKVRIPKIEIDTEKVELVIQNLIENAVKYSPSGGDIIVSLEYDTDKKEINLSVKDSGVGIPKDQQVDVFNKFFRGANILRLDTEGSGLGLFISKNIIEAHGGKIFFTSEEGKGSTFTIILPIKHKLL